MAEIQTIQSFESCSSDGSSGERFALLCACTEIESLDSRNMARLAERHVDLERQTKFGRTARRSTKFAKNT